MQYVLATYVGLCQLCTKLNILQCEESYTAFSVCNIAYLTLQYLQFCTQLTKAYVAEMLCISCY